MFGLIDFWRVYDISWMYEAFTQDFQGVMVSKEMMERAI